MAGQRNRFLADALHQAAVAGDDIGVVVDHVRAELAGQHALTQGETDRIGDALAQRAGGGLGDGDMAIFRMAGGARAELAEILDLLDVDILIAGQIGERVEQHRAMAGGQDEAVAVGPMRVLGVELQEAGEEHCGDVGHAHRHAGMSGIGLLNGIGGQEADGIGHVAGGHGVQGGHERGSSAWAVRQPFGPIHRLMQAPRRSFLIDNVVTNPACGTAITCRA